MKFQFTYLNIAACLLFFAVGAAAQADQKSPESSYEITLSVLSGSNDATQKSELPQSLAPISWFSPSPFVRRWCAKQATIPTGGFSLYGWRPR